MDIHGGEKMISKNSDVYGLNITHYLGRSFLSIALLFFLTTCTGATLKKMDEAGYIWLPSEDKSSETVIEESEPIEQKEIATNTPDFIPITEELSPLKTQIVSIAARNTPLGDVLLVIADSAKLNLVLEKGVNPETLITLTLNKVSVEVALDTIFTSVDYFYSVKGNMLRVKAMDTRIFEFGQPSILQDYFVEVGGDILGGAIGAVSSLGGSASSDVKGSVIQKLKADANSFTKFWASVDSTIKNLIGVSATTQATTGGTTEVINLKPKFTINQLTGTIVVTATKNDLEKVNRYLTTLKNILNRQVLIEVRIVEVQLSEEMKYGIDWTFLDSWTGYGTISLGTDVYSDVVGTTLPRLQFSVTESDFVTLLHALQKQGEVRTLSNPRVNIMNAQTAVLSVGRSQSFISKVETTTSSGATAITTFTVDTGSVLSGIIIGIVPYINEKGETTLTITPIISDLYELEDKTVGVVGSNTIEISLPTVDLRELSTTIKLKNNEMVIIGGLITKEDRLDDYEVPILGKIPLLGYLFKRHSKTAENTELIIMLKPTVSMTN